MSYNEKELQTKLQEEKQNIVLPPKKETIGEILQNKRVELNKSIEEISDYLRIKPQYLKALEENNFNNLPGSAYVIGFIKSYASFLNLNPNDIIVQYKQETGAFSLSENPLTEDENSLIQDPIINSNHIIIGGVVVLIAIVFVIFLNSSEKQSSEIMGKEGQQISEVQPNMEISIQNTNISDNKNAPATLNTSDNGVKPFEITTISSNDTNITNNESVNTESSKETTTSVTQLNTTPEYFETKVDNIELQLPQSDVNLLTTFNSSDDEGSENETDTNIASGNEYGLMNKEDSQIQLRATKNVWIKLKKDGLYKYDSDLGDVGTGESVFEAILKPGDIYYIPNGDDYFLTIGNAQGVDIIVDGEVIAPLSTREVSRHNIEMSVEKLKNGTAYIRNRVIE